MMANRRIIIDNGHGGRDPGACGFGLQEKDITLNLAQKIMRQLAQYPVEIILTRASNYTVSLEERVKMANQENAALFLSIHINAGGGTGFESYIHPAASVKTVNYQAKIHAAIMAFLRGEGVVDRGMKRKNFYVLRETKMPAVLCENLFIDNEKDVGLLKSETFLSDLAGAYVNGIVNALELEKYADTDNILPWAKNTVEKAVSIGLVANPELLNESEQKVLCWLDRLGLLERKVVAGE